MLSRALRVWGMTRMVGRVSSGSDGWRACRPGRAPEVMGRLVDDAAETPGSCAGQF